MSRFLLSQEALFNCMASVVSCAVQRPSRRLEPIELIVKFKKCEKQQYKLLTGSVRLNHSPNPRFRACVVGDEQHIQEALANQLDFLDLPALKEVSKIPAVARVIAQKYDAFLVSKPLLSKFNAYFGYALAGANKAPPYGLAGEQHVMTRIEEAKNTARIRRKRNDLVVAVGHVAMLPEHLMQNVNRVVTHLTRSLKQNPDVVIHSLCVKSRSGPKVKLC